MRSLAASLLMSQGMLCNVTEPETLSDGRDTPKGRVKEEAPLGARRGTNYMRLITLPPNPMGGLPEI